MVKVTREDMVVDISKRTGFAKIYTRMFMKELENSIIYFMNKAEPYGPSEKVAIRLCSGIELGAIRMPRRKVRNPRTGEMVWKDEYLRPSCRFNQRFRDTVTLPPEIPTEDDHYYEHMLSGGYFEDIYDEIYQEEE